MTRKGKTQVLWDESQVILNPADAIREFRVRESSMIRTIHLLQLDWPESIGTTCAVAGFVTPGLVFDATKTPILYTALKHALHQYHDDLVSSDRARLKTYLCALYGGIALALETLLLKDGVGDIWDPASGIPLCEWAAGRSRISVQRHAGDSAVIQNVMAEKTLSESLQLVLGGTKQEAVCGR
jgi:hypothetical protein